MRRFMVLLAGFALIVAACGGTAGPSDGADPSDPSEAVSQGTEGTTEPSAPATSAADTVQGGSGAAPISGVIGVLTANGESFDAQVFRCEPFTSLGREPHQDDLSVVAFISDTGGLNADISYSPGIDMNNGNEYLSGRLDLLYSVSGDEGLIQFESVAINDAEGNWFSDELAEDRTPFETAPFAVDGNRLTGAAALTQVWPEGGDGVVDVSFDLEIPADIHTDC